MKSIHCLLAGILCFTLLFSSCAVPAAESSSNGYGTVPAVSVPDPSGDTAGDTARAGQVYTYDGSPHVSEKYSYPAYSYTEYTPYTKLKRSPVLPDTLESVFRGARDSAEGTAYHVYALDADLMIPEGHCVTVIPGLYIDREGNEVTLEFVDEYVVTAGQYSEQELTDMIRAVKIPCDEEGEKLAPLVYRQGIVPDGIRLVFSVFRKEYIPLSGLFVAEMGGGFSGKRTAGDYCYQVVYDSGNLQVVTEKLQDLAVGTPRTRYNEFDPYWDQYSLMLNACSDALLTNTSTLTDVMHLRMGTTFHVKNPDCSVVNAAWMNAYGEALGQLNADPNHYHHETGTIRFAFEDGELTPTESKFREYENELLTGWYTDESSDWKLKAMICANLTCLGEKVSLEDIVILFHETEGDRAFAAMIADHGSGEMTLIDKGFDDLDAADFTFAYRYAQEYLAD